MAGRLLLRLTSGRISHGSPYGIPWVLQAFHERMPKVEVVITVVMSEEIPEAIIDGKQR